MKTLKELIQDEVDASLLKTLNDILLESKIVDDTSYWNEVLKDIQRLFLNSAKRLGMGTKIKPKLSSDGMKLTYIALEYPQDFGVPSCEAEFLGFSPNNRNDLSGGHSILINNSDIRPSHALMPSDFIKWSGNPRKDAEKLIKHVIDAMNYTMSIYN
jgi:hypothetical protein